MHHTSQDDIDQDFIAFDQMGSATADSNKQPEQQQTNTDGPSTSGRVLGYKPPWLSRIGHFISPLLRLHNEIAFFCKMLEPTAQEAEARQQSVDDVRQVVNSIWPQATVEVFGSFATGKFTVHMCHDSSLANTVLLFFVCFTFFVAVHTPILASFEYPILHHALLLCITVLHSLPA